MKKLKITAIAITLLGIGIAFGSLVFPREVRSFSAVGYVSFPENLEFSHSRSFSSVLAKFDLTPAVHGDGPNGTTIVYSSRSSPYARASVFTGFDSADLTTRKEITIVKFAISAPTEIMAYEIAREFTIELQNMGSK